MNEEIRFKGGDKPVNKGFASPHVAGVPEDEPDEAVNDSLGSIHPADTMDSDPKNDQETGSKGVEGADKGIKN
jgi:hypothetical protein